MGLLQLGANPLDDVGEDANVVGGWKTGRLTRFSLSSTWSVLALLSVVLVRRTRSVQPSGIKCTRNNSPGM
ncbi:hypothetical protein IMZ48_49510 [Candidatus Bathyarchaeota archaeon]|nr:hypothetical protein [Candidatus Bathyarchaeota archaeon]